MDLLEGANKNYYYFYFNFGKYGEEGIRKPENKVIANRLCHMVKLLAQFNVNIGNKTKGGRPVHMTAFTLVCKFCSKIYFREQICLCEGNFSTFAYMQNLRIRLFRNHSYFMCSKRFNLFF